MLCLCLWLFFYVFCDMSLSFFLIICRLSFSMCLLCVSPFFFYVSILYLCSFSTSLFYVSILYLCSFSTSLFYVSVSVLSVCLGSSSSSSFSLSLFCLSAYSTLSLHQLFYLCLWIFYVICISKYCSTLPPIFSFRSFLWQSLFYFLFLSLFFFISLDISATILSVSLFLSMI